MYIDMAEWYGTQSAPTYKPSADPSSSDSKGLQPRHMPWTAAAPYKDLHTVLMSLMHWGRLLCPSGRCTLDGD